VTKPRHNSKLFYHIPTLREFVDGEPTFQGTRNFGRGGYRQLAGGLHPAVQKIADQEADENNANVKSQAWSLGKFGNVLPTGDEDTTVYSEALPGDQFYRHLPGYPEKAGTLEKGVNHVPDDNSEEVSLYYQKQEEKYKDDMYEKYGLRIEGNNVYGTTKSDRMGVNDKDNMIAMASQYLVSPKDYLEIEDNDDSEEVRSLSSLVAPKKFVPDDDTGLEPGGYARDPLYRNSQLNNMIEAMIAEILVETNAKDIRRLLRKYDCVELRQNGSHLQVKCGQCISTIPVHGSDDIRTGTLKSIEKSLGICLGPDWTKVDRKGHKERF
jgi:predicted RNA binding protein YcfA (HicA-like mRNA interferase family)